MLCRETTAEYKGPDESDIPRSEPKGKAAQSDKHKEKTKLRRIIPLIDKNGDGKISVQELAAWTDRSMKGFYKQEAESRLKELDTNKDGKVSWEEYVKGAENRGGFNEKKRKRERRRFEHANINKDGLLSRDELISMFHPEESPNMFGVIVEEFMEFVDTDKDGFLSFDEYKGKTVDTGNTDQRTAKESFKKLDQDNDGKLNKEEMKLWLGAVNTSAQAKNQAQRQVSLADDNKDGVLSEREIIDHIDVFTGGGEGLRTGQTAKDEL
ncbi:hypothetical protein ACROYT_G000091 [Oculina patagonica]